MRKPPRWFLVLMPTVPYVASFVLPVEANWEEWPINSGLIGVPIKILVALSYGGERLGWTAWLFLPVLLANPMIVVGILLVWSGRHRFAIGFGIAALVLTIWFPFLLRDCVTMPCWWAWQA
jgi:hypothetical protein